MAIANSLPQEEVAIPTFRQIDNLPQLLREGTKQFKTEYEKDLFLYSALTVSSGLLTKISGVYNQGKYFPNLFLLVVAQFGSGKSAMMYAQKLVGKIHEKVLNESLKADEEYRMKLKLVKKKQNEELSPKPPFKVVLIPANCTSSKFISHLFDNELSDIPAILIESEIDTMTVAQNNEHGNFSDVLRKAFQNESVSKSRKSDNEYLFVNSPKLAIALSGTINQVKKLITNSEDGLYSRFLVYSLDTGIQWSDVSPCHGCVNLTDFFDKQAVEYLEFYEYVSKKHYEVRLTDEQWRILNEDFGNELSYVAVFGDPNSSGLIKRHGLMVFKMCMTLTGFRIHEGKIESDIVECKQEDFETALFLVKKSLEASKGLFQQLPGGGNKQSDTKNDTLYKQLPDEFTHADAIGLAQTLGVADRTIERHLRRLVKEVLLIQPERGKYKKVSV